MLWRLVLGLIILIWYLYQSVVEMQNIRHDWTGVISQSRGYSCGYASLDMILKFYNLPSKGIGDSKPLSILEIVTLSQASNLNASGYRCSANKLSQLNSPCVLHFDNHFVVLDSLRNGIAHIRDPMRGHLKLDTAKLKQMWDGNVILFSTEPFN